MLVIISGPSGRRQGHDHRCAQAPAARSRLPLRRDLHDARDAPRARSTASTTTSSTARRSPPSAPPASSSRRTRSTATGTARRAARSARRWRPAATSSSRSTSRAPRSSRRRSPGALLIFLIPPSLEDLFQRLRSRATETADELELRQRNAAIELARQEDYDYVVTNETGQVERTAERIDEIIAEEHRRHPDRRVEVYPRSP